MKVADGKCVAVVDDDPLFLAQITSVLQHEGGMRPVPVSDGDQLFQSLSEREVACIVMDYDLGKETGLSVVQTLKQKMASPPPVVMLTGAGSERIAVKAFRMGISDYVPKRHFDGKELVKSVRDAILRSETDRAARDRAHWVRQHQRLDHITGLHTEAFVRARLQELASGRFSTRFAIAAFKPQNLMSIREQLGHTGAERLFRDFAAHTNGLSVGQAFFGHLGTDTLACVLERQASRSGIEEIGALISEKLQFSQKYDWLEVDVSAIVATAMYPEDGDTPDEVISSVLEQLQRQSSPAGSSDGSSGQTSDVSDRRRNPDGTAGIERRSEQRRAEQRHRILKRGKILVDGLNIIMDCSVRNISQSGACIRLGGHYALPPRFKLTIAGTHDARWVEPRWQVGVDIGVRYEKERS